MNKVWLRACLVGRIVGADTPKQGDGAFISALSLSGGDGHKFCSGTGEGTAMLSGRGHRIAELEQVFRDQTGAVWSASDLYEGLVLSYDPKGEISWSRRYASVYDADPKKLTARNPNSE